MDGDRLVTDKPQVHVETIDAMDPRTWTSSGTQSWIFEEPSSRRSQPVVKISPRPQRIAYSFARNAISTRHVS